MRAREELSTALQSTSAGKPSVLSGFSLKQPPALQLPLRTRSASCMVAECVCRLAPVCVYAERRVLPRST